MRIAQLDLKAFGHFTNRTIVFAGACDFHLAYGPNEAGKTTISRALNAALFGVPERTTDNFVHSNSDLRVGVVLEAKSGDRLAAMRRKARKNSLVAYAPDTGLERTEAIPEDRLTSWMGGLSEGLFASMFRLDHDELVAGGKALAEGKGELGQSLFEAGAGLTSIRKLRERLSTEADDLFRPRASTSTIYKVLGQYDDARKEAKAAQTRPAEWEALNQQVDAARRAYDAARSRQDDLQREARRLERLAAVLPDVAGRAHTLQQLSLLANVTLLPPEQADTRIAIEGRLRQAQDSCARASDNLARLRAELVALTIPDAVLAQSRAIETLHFSLENYQKARTTAATTRGKTDLADQQVATLVAQLGATGRESVRDLIPPATLRARVQSLMTRDAALQAELNNAMRLAKSADREATELRDELVQLDSQEVPPALANLLDGLDAQGDPEARAAQLHRDAQGQLTSLSREAQALGYSSVEDLAGARTPLPAELLRFKADSDALQIRRRSLRERLESIQDDLMAITGEMEALTSQGEVPTAEQLARERSTRDGLWLRIRKQVYPESAGEQQVSPIPSAQEYESSIQAADLTADHRYSDASRVGHHESLHKRLVQMQRSIDMEQQRLTAADDEFAKLNATWSSLLTTLGLPTLGIAATEDWMARREAFLLRYAAYTDTTALATTFARQADDLRGELNIALVESGLPAVGVKETLAQVILRARAFQRLANEAAASRKVLQRKLKLAEDRVSEAKVQIDGAERLVAAWQHTWGEAMASIHLAADAGAAEAAARLEQFDQLADSLDVRDTGRKELAAAEKAIGEFEQGAERLAAEVGLHSHDRPADVLVATLHDLLTDGRQMADRARSLAERIKEGERNRAEGERDVQQAETDLKAMMAAAHCSTMAELVMAENQCADRRRLELDLTKAESRLVTSSAMPLAEILAQAEGQDLLQVQAALAGATQDLDELKPQVESLHTVLIEEENKLGRVDGSARSAAAEQDAADAAAKLTSLVASYSSARLASVILGEVIESYQQRNQAPMLARASQVFAAITGGRFVGVAADFDEDLTILVAVKPDGGRLKVGQLSSGRRDQLFLALRLAAIESHVTRQEPLPIIVDDILINFDDAASSATFQILAELSRATQVLFFTHHEHLLDKATSALGVDRYVAHRL